MVVGTRQDEVSTLRVSSGDDPGTEQGGDIKTEATSRT